MATLEQELIEKIGKLDDAAKLRVLAVVEQELETPKLTQNEWLEQAIALSEELRLKYGDGYYFGVQDMLDEIREEASWPRW